MNSDFVSIRGLSLPRRMVLQGITSLLGGALRLAPSPLLRNPVGCRSVT